MTELLPLHILFLILQVFIVFNLIVGIIFKVKLKDKSEVINYLAPYWATVLIVFTLQGLGQNGFHEIALSFSTNILPILIISNLLAKSIDKKVPNLTFIIIYILSCFVSLYLDTLSLSFTLKALPIALAVSAPMIWTGYITFTSKNIHVMSKLLSSCIVFCIIPVLAWLFFRMVPGTQFWGWVFPFASYQMIALSLVCYSIFDVLKSENYKLENIVQKRTAELQSQKEDLNRNNQNLKKTQSSLELSNYTLAKTKEQNEILLKAVVHDIGTPLTIIGLAAKQLCSTSIVDMSRQINSISKASNNLNQIIGSVKERILAKREESTLTLESIDIKECLSDIQFSFNERLNEKKIELILENRLGPSVGFLADKRSIVNSVLNNFISNAIKFSFANSRIIISADKIEELNQVKIKIKDFGQGIKKSRLSSILDLNTITSTKGTSMESGTGFGVSIALDYITACGGHLEVESNFIDDNPEYHGTTFIITFKMAQIESAPLLGKTVDLTPSSVQ